LCLAITGAVASFNNLFTIIFANYPYYTIFYGNVWRLLTSIFVADGILTAAVSILVLWFVLPQLVFFKIFRKEIFQQ
jgi:membrane associated rhomboid family serine protease